MYLTLKLLAWVHRLAQSSPTLDVPAFEVATGVGINISEADIQGWLDEQFKANEAEIAE